jgi:hypothetical protein
MIGQNVTSEADARTAETAGKQAEWPDRRPPELLFEREDWALYLSLAHLPQKAGIAADQLARLVVKEITDNALDAADMAGRPGAVAVQINDGNLTVTDQGTGIADATPEKLARIYSVARPMLSSKLVRRPSRGAVGNGLRVVLGYLTATRARLTVATGHVRVTLDPEPDGTSRIARAEIIAPITGLSLTVTHGDQLFTQDDCAWARDAIELAKQSGQPAFTGKPSLHWLDADHFHALTRATVGEVTIRQFLAAFDGLAGSVAQSKVAARFLRRPLGSLTTQDATELLRAGQNATRAPKPKALCPLGRDAVIADGYALAEGHFTEGAHSPRATLPFLVEAWVDAHHPRERSYSTLSLYMNRTVALAPTSGNTGHNYIHLTISNARVLAEIPEGPHYSIHINITSPAFRLLSDGKAPDCAPFRDAIAIAVSKAAKHAGRDIATQMSAAEKRETAALRVEEREDAREQRLSDREARQARRAQLEVERAERIAERKARPSVKEATLSLLPDAVKRAEADGYLFNSRHIVYAIREQVRQLSGKELKQAYFDALLTEWEAENGDLSPFLIREARGNFSIPHTDAGTVPLGTVSVRNFRRPSWTFNKILVIEKEDLRLMLEQAGWDRRHDCLLMSSKGFNTRAARDLIDGIAETTEPVRVFNTHDADAAGTVIQHALQHATLARGARKIEIIDLGLQPWDGIALGLQVEKVPASHKKDGEPIRRRPVGAYIKARSDRAPTGEVWEEWLQHSRFELNAFSSADLIAWLDDKLAEHDAGKLIPPEDILVDGFGECVRERAELAVANAITQRRDTRIAAIEAARAKATAPIRREIDRIAAPLLAEIDRLTAPLHRQLSEAAAPFGAEITAAHTEAKETNREAVIADTITAMTPNPEKLRDGIEKRFRREPAARWLTMLERIADATKLGKIKLPENGSGGAL